VRIRPRNRRTKLLIGVLGAFALMLLGMGASLVVKSPQQVAAESAPPKATAITAQVVRQVLVSSVVVRGTVTPGATIQVEGAAPAGAKAVVTKVKVAQGAKVRAGKVVAEISNRPIIVLRGIIPSFRDLQMGATGTDVVQLQNALTGLGYVDADKTGIFGKGTATAIKALYRDSGYPAPTTTSGGAAGDKGGTGRGNGAAASPSTTPTTRQTTVKANPTPRTKPSSSGQQSIPAPQMAYLPQNEVVFVPRLPATVTSIPLAVGQPVGSLPVMQLASGGLMVQGTVPVEDRGLVRTRMPVDIYSEELDKKVSGHVSSLGNLGQAASPPNQANPGGQSNGGSSPQNNGQGVGGQQGAGNELSGIPLGVAADGTMPTDFAGRDVRLTITAASTGSPVLVVPVAAVYSAADSMTHVTKFAATGKQIRVPVKTGASGNGFVQITPVAGGVLVEGDRVVVGQ
jgi:HlyD family secretion protein